MTDKDHHLLVLALFLSHPCNFYALFTNYYEIEVVARPKHNCDNFDFVESKHKPQNNIKGTRF